MSDKSEISSYCLSALKPVAILVDGAFFLKRYRRCYPDVINYTAGMVADNMYDMLMRHVEGARLYRIFFYDCPPLEETKQHPINNRLIDFGASRGAKFRRAFHNALKRKRKVALRLGDLQAYDDWVIHPAATKALLQNQRSVGDLQESDVSLSIRQKGVDMKIGLDIASLAYKQLVDRIVLIAGDSDFVPAAKLARREGIDFILDPMWAPIRPSLHEHIDGLVSQCDKPPVGGAR